ncbi:MAG: hypothetical protein WDZ72_12940 [Cyclobacteriaceae bacterium]
MKALKTILYFACILGVFSCSNDPEEEPLVEKTARIEIEMEGSVDQYLVNFGIHNLYKGQSGFVRPVIVQPDELEWTQVIEQANTFNLSTYGSFSRLIVESEEPVHTVFFIFNLVNIGDIPN